MSTGTRFYIGQRVKRREMCPLCNGHGWVDPRPPAAAEAADTIARLTRERDEARAQVDRLREALERVKAERNRLRHEAALFRVLLLLAALYGLFYLAY